MNKFITKINEKKMVLPRIYTGATKHKLCCALQKTHSPFSSVIRYLLFKRFINKEEEKRITLAK